MPYFKSHSQKIEDAAERVRQLREAVGPEVDLCIEIHRRMTPPEAVPLARAIEPYKPMFFEDPLRPNDPDAMVWVADHIHIPVATGERLISLYQFQTLLNRRAIAYLRPDVCLCGGITDAKKIAALVEANDSSVEPRNPLSLVSTAACLSRPASRTLRSRNIRPRRPTFTARATFWVPEPSPALRSRGPDSCPFRMGRGSGRTGA